MNNLKIKQYLQLFLIQVFKIIPNNLIKLILKYFPRLGVCAPPNIEFIINNYLGIYKVNINTSSCVERYMLRGTYEPSNLRIIENYVKEGDCCIDIGANVGAITLAFAKKIGNNGNVYSFEPHPIYFKKLLQNIKNNNLEDKVYTFNKGISSSNDSLLLEEDIRTEGVGNAGIVSTESINSFKIEVVKFDNFVLTNNLTNVDFIKIDVEGHEKEVLLGSIDVIKKFHPKILFETLTIFNSDLNGEKFTEIERIFDLYQYNIYGVDQLGNLIKINKIGKFPMTFAIPIFLDKSTKL